MRRVLFGVAVFGHLTVAQQGSRITVVTNQWFQFWKSNRHQHDEKMGQAVRVMKYDRAANEASAIPALNMLGKSLSWYRLDDGVMGGQSETVHSNVGGLHFTGTINTEGGGFTSIRAKIPQGLLSKDVEAFRIRFRGDGKTYKFLLSDGKGATGGPFARSPSWQVDIPTQKQGESGEVQEITLPLSSFLPAWGGRASSKPSGEEQQKYKFDLSEMQEIGLMLSLKLSDGTPYPKETFGEGVFPFSLLVESIEPLAPSTTKG